VGGEPPGSPQGQGIIVRVFSPLLMFRFSVRVGGGVGVEVVGDSPFPPTSMRGGRRREEYGMPV